MSITKAEVARYRERLLADAYKHFYWPIPKAFDSEDGRFGKVAHAMMVRVNKKLLPNQDPNVWTLKTTQAIVKLTADPVTPLEVAKRFLGPIETLGNNLGPKVAQVQRSTDLAPGSWPYCAAGVFYCAREAGWNASSAFRRMELEAWVPAWVDSARKGEHGLMVVSQSMARPNDAIAFNWGGSFGSFILYDHIGWVRTHPNRGMIGTREFNTGPGAGGNQSDGDGCWDRIRPLNPGVVIIRFTTEKWR